jgi:hypothetical protein
LILVQIQFATLHFWTVISLDEYNINDVDRVTRCPFADV